jgi:hypothetical protein
MSERPAARAALGVTSFLVLPAFAFWFAFTAGQRGFYPFDQSIVFDGGYRVLSGQVPYSDFVFPFGPVAFWLQALFFRLFGVSYFGYLMGAAVINAAATLCAVSVVRQLLPRSRLLPLASGLLTAVWFYPPFGTPWVDQTGFFFGLLGLVAVIWAVVRTDAPSRRVLAIIGSGSLAFLTFISKQNVGAFIFLLYPLIIAVAHWREARRMLQGLLLFTLGFAGSLGIFVVWLYLESDCATFIRYFFEIPSALGSERLAALVGSWFGLLRPFFGGRGPLVVNVVIWVSLAGSVYALARLSARKQSQVQASLRVRLASTVCIYLILFQHVFMYTTLNQPENALGFFGIIFGLAGGLLLGNLNERRGLRWALKVGIAAALVLASIAGIRTSMNRKVQDILSGATYDRPVPIEKMRHLRWAHPTRMGSFDISEQSIVDLYTYLAQRRENFFIFPDFTIFYGLLERPSPQPVLWFHEGVTYARASTDELDERIVRDIEANGVRILVLEQVSWFNTGERLNDFPRMKSYIMRNFAKVGQIETFSLYEKVSDGR